MTVAKQLSFSFADRYDVAATASIVALGHGDPCLKVDGPNRVRMTTLGPEGAIAVYLKSHSNHVEVTVSGRDSDWVTPRLPSWLGLDFQVPQFEGPLRLRTLARRFAGLRLIQVPTLFPRLVQLVLQQLVSFQDACDGWRTLVRRYGEPIADNDDLFAPPTAAVLARLASHDFISCGILPQHGHRIIGLARIARRIESVWDGGKQDTVDATCALLAKQRGVGPWTVGYLRGSAMADSDATVLGDYGFPRRVAYFFSGAEDADDDDMLRLLDPFRPHRFYVLSLLLKGGPVPPRRGPRATRLRYRLKPFGGR